MRRGTVVIDDFHRLDPSTKADVADHLKYLADTEPADLKMVVVGIPHTGRALIELAPDLATRIDVFPFQKAPDGLVAQVIEKGERALNAIFTRKTEIVIEAAGSLNLAQYLCFHLCEAQGVHETQQVPTAITGDIATAFESVMRALTGKFGEAVRRFAALGGPADHTCLDLLGELALNSEEGVLSLNQLKDTQPRLARGIDQFFREEWFQSLCEAYPNAANCLFVDRVTGTLVADDPQLLFYLRRVSYSQLAHSAGKSRVPGDERPAYGGTREAPAEGGAADPRWSRYDAFVSYRRQEPDQGFARDLVVRLEKDGYAVAIDERDFAPNDTFLSEMERCVRESRFTLAVVSPRYLSNPTCTEEAVICKVMDMGERRRRLIPLVMEKVEVPLWMYDIVGIDFASTDPLVDPMARLEQALGRPSNSEATSQNRHVDPEALELILVGYMMTVCGEAGQIFRPTSMLDHGIDGEVEFKDDEGRASGSRIYVQLKSGGSYLRRRRSDGKEVFLVHNERHLEYLAKSRDDVYLVGRDAVGSVRWTNMTRILRGRNDKESREVVFEGERLDAAAVRRVRDRVLG